MSTGERERERERERDNNIYKTNVLKLGELINNNLHETKLTLTYNSGIYVKMMRS